MAIQQDLSNEEAKSVTELNSSKDIDSVTQSDESDFSNRYHWLFEKAATDLGESSIINMTEISTPLGPMLAGQHHRASAY